MRPRIIEDETTDMKRHQKLQDLSREHHGALQLALRAKRAAMSGDQIQIKEGAAACLAAFYAELDPHFVVEENTLLHFLLTAGEDKLVTRVECDHKELRRLSVQLRQPDAMTLLGFAELLTSHVRFEEREMFVVLEALFDCE
ncbi:hemerythrin domain-containing protein [Propionivibrio sp.]|uniref:hemerythrin domain-containing protein n=1 Tax=Propionivibrio sp. TaxID=2212460 RepID=UPI0025D59CAD|nr:hemerythrin domain-containing protein [Propionivibrio sp.]